MRSIKPLRDGFSVNLYLPALGYLQDVEGVYAHLIDALGFGFLAV